MELPSPFTLSFSSISWLILLYVLYLGSYQFYQIKIKKAPYRKNIVPLGYLALIFTIIDYILGMKTAFETIAEAGDISPALVAGSMSYSMNSLFLGLITLAITYLFQYINQ
ncbi:MAG: hypothetical protein AAFQ94_26875 [Bacteroidota bacterium]